MKSVDIRLGTIQDVRNFVNIMSRIETDCDLTSGRYIVDAKSIMGIFSLDLLSPIKLTIHSDNCDDVMKLIEPYIVK